MKLIPSKNKKKFFKIFIGEEFIGSIPEKLLPPEYFILSDDECPEEFVKMVREWVYENGKNNLLDYLSKMERTVFDSKNYLRKWDVPENIINVIVQEAQDKKWLSDERFARFYAEEAIICGRSPLDVKFKLTQKKINQDIINRVVDELFTSETKIELIENYIEKLIKRYTDLEKNKIFEKIATTLYRKGFQYSDYEIILQKKINEI